MNRDKDRDGKLREEIARARERRRYKCGVKGLNRINLYTRKDATSIQVSWVDDRGRMRRALRTPGGKSISDWGFAVAIAKHMSEAQAAKMGLPPTPAAPPHEREGFVYVVQAASGKTKIGFSNDPDRRLTHLKGASPEPLHLVATYPGTPEDEARLHRLADDHHLRREWFTEDVIQLVARYFDFPPPTPPAPEVAL